tara:strand:- start:1462 stop:2412 length:951 start_codon:yes stop_codon:yes gene_type:complete
MNILITGVAGFIGSSVCKKFLEKGFNVHGLDNFDDYYDVNLKKARIKNLKKNKNFFFYNLDLSKIKNIKIKKFDLMINLAAQAGVRLPRSMHHKYISSNIDGFRHFLQFSNKVSCEYLIYASSSSVYSSLRKTPFEENQKLDVPLSKYAESKLDNEKEANDFAQKNEKKIVGLRFFTVYGPFGRPDMAYFDFTKKILNREEIRLFNSGETYRDMTYIDDIVSGVFLASEYLKKEKFKHQIFNLGNGKPINTKLLVSCIEREFKINALIKYITSEKEVKITFADITKARKKLNYRPETNFDEGIKRFFNWFKEYYEV